MIIYADVSVKWLHQIPIRLVNLCNAAVQHDNCGQKLGKKGWGVSGVWGMGFRPSE